MTTGMVFSVQRFSVHDGPGIRTTVFLKGCPLRCPWCQNPEGLTRSARVWNFDNLCGGCGNCLSVCPTGALRMGPDRRPVIDHDRCTVCGGCIRECVRNALAVDGWEVSAAELAETLLADAVFYTAAGGGVSFSGGEPLAQADFVRDVAERCHRAGINTAVETCLEVPWDAVLPTLGVIDHFLVDIKFADSGRHRSVTGVGNDRILDNFRRLARVLPADRLRVRLPLIPGFTAEADNIAEVADIVRAANAEVPLELLNFNPLAEAKYRRMALRNDFPSDARAYSDDEMAAFRSIAAGRVRLV
ncbi:MAG: glycyl-radical enzyme activating protein [Planctomycetes bacterium]|nr:glycyl-radical enzyme activating protein [Planctomycetota bacterium]